MSRSLFVIENPETAPRTRLGRFWGVTIMATSLAWLGPCLYFGAGLFVAVAKAALAGWPALPNAAALAGALPEAVVIALAVRGASLLHAWGHIAGGRLVGYPMDELLITSTRDVNVYHGDQEHLPPRVHLARSLGGPVANLAAAALVVAPALLLPPGLGGDAVRWFGAFSLLTGMGAFLPIPTVDGEVIWREVRRLRSR